MLRTGYTARVKPFRDSEQSVEIRWYRCHPSAPALPYPSRIRSLHWESHPYLFAAGNGEVFNSLKRVYPFKWLPGLDGSHPPCGEERDFTEGGHYDPDSPPIPVTGDGVPQCCAEPPGGVVLGGTGVVGPGLLAGGGATWSLDRGNASALSATATEWQRSAYVLLEPAADTGQYWWRDTLEMVAGRTYRFRLKLMGSQLYTIDLGAPFPPFAEGYFSDATPRNEWDVTFTPAFFNGLYLHLVQVSGGFQGELWGLAFLEDVTP